MGKVGGSAGADKTTQKGMSTSTVNDKYGVGSSLDAADRNTNQNDAFGYLRSIISAASGGPGSVGAGATGTGGGSSGTMTGDTSGGNAQAEQNASDAFSKLFKTNVAQATSGPTASQGGIARQGFAQGGAANAAQQSIIGDATNASQDLMLDNSANNAVALGLSPRQTNTSGQKTSENVSGGGQVGCCFIFMEALGPLPWYVRYARNLNHTNRRELGYRTMSRWLVPAMRVSKMVRYIVDVVMIKPLCKAGETRYTENETMIGHLCVPIVHVWFKVWDIVGYMKGAK